MSKVQSSRYLCEFKWHCRHGYTDWITPEGVLPRSLDEVVDLISEHHEVVRGNTLHVDRQHDPAGYMFRCTEIHGDSAYDVTDEALIAYGQWFTARGDEWPWWMSDLNPASKRAA